MFDTSKSRIMLHDIPNNLKEIYIFKAIFDEDFVYHIVEETKNILNL